MVTATEPTPSAEASAYEAEILSWRQRLEDQLRAENGWLTLTGLYWLREGDNSVGSDPLADVLLPESAPQRLGTINLHEGVTTLRVTSDTETTIDGELTRAAVLRHDYDPLGFSRVVIGSVSFHVLKRGDQYAIRVRDLNNLARQTFAGRNWFAIDPAYRVTATYTPHEQPHDLTTGTVAGVDIPMENPGYVEFTLGERRLRLEAFSGSNGQIWFVFRETSPQTYRAGRFLYTTVDADGTAVVDFNKAYNPPCAFTPYATCPLPPKENILTFPIEVGEAAPKAH
ncbi:MAG: DUF1684 domain-containing protein [Anaerolineae bacterium]|nr:DUF1684 domain-containing protein [Anaerolineae bacterium]